MSGGDGGVDGVSVDIGEDGGDDIDTEGGCGTDVMTVT